MREGYLPKVTVALLVLAAAFVIVSNQPTLVAAHPTHTRGNWSWWGNGYGNCYYGGYNSHYDGYPYSYCTYEYYYPYYSYYYPYYGYYGNYSYYYPYYGYPYYSYYSPYYSYYGYYGYNYAPTSYQLTVSTNPSSLGTVTGAGSYSSGTSASFSVTQTTIQTSSNTRYVFSHWSGDYSGVGTSGSVTMNGAKKIVAEYQAQYYLTANSQPQTVPAPQGSGWYNAGDTATVNSPGQMINGDSQSRLVMQGWSVDGQNSQPSAVLSVKMDAPHTVTALYGQQYYLNVLSDQGTASGAGWYDAGTSAQVYASPPPSSSYGTSYVFNGWQGDIQSSSQASSVTIDKAKTVIATWRTDSTVLYATIGLVLIALLIAVGILALAIRGRQAQTQTTYVTPPPQPAQPAAAQPPPHPTETTQSTTQTTTHHRKKQTEEQPQQQ